jgi:hypothetical protein
MFAPRHRQTADEMARVCSSGGTIGLCCWTPEGTVGEVFGATAKYQPPPPEYASPPILWGTEEYVREMFPSATDFAFERRDAIVAWESAEGFADFFMDRFGPLVAAKAMLGERFADLRADTIAVWERRNEAEDGSLLFRQEYLVSVVSF